MEVKKGEEEWITNIRKSVVTHLRSVPLRSNMGKHEGDSSLDLIFAHKDDTAPINFVIEEDTILGRCPSE